MGETNTDRLLRQASDRIVDEPSERLLQLSDEMFSKVAAYVKAELGQPIDDLALMEKINNITASRYSKMADQMANVNAEVAELYDAYTTVAVSMEKIDEVEQGITSLESAVSSLEQYTARLEDKVQAAVAASSTTS